MQNIHRVEKRRHIRLQAELPAQLIAAGQQKFSVKGVAISMGGMQIICDNWDAQQLIPKGTVVTLANPIKVTARFKPTLKRQEIASVSIDSEIIEAVRLSENTYQMHLRFLDFAKSSKDAVEDFINKLF